MERKLNGLHSPLAPVFSFSASRVHMNILPGRMRILTCLAMNWPHLIRRPCITQNAKELSTYQVNFQSFPWIFLVDLLQTVPVKAVPNSHKCGWRSHCVFKSQSFRTQKTLFLTRHVRDSDFPRVAYKSPFIPQCIRQIPTRC